MGRGPRHSPLPPAGGSCNRAQPLVVSCHTRGPVEAWNNTPLLRLHGQVPIFVIVHLAGSLQEERRQGAEMSAGNRRTSRQKGLSGRPELWDHDPPRRNAMPGTTLAVVFGSWLLLLILTLLSFFRKNHTEDSR